MSNNCDFEARLKGRKKDVLKLAEWMSAEYNYSENTDMKCFINDPEKGKVPTEHHIGWRIFEAYHSPDTLKDCKDNEKVLYTVSGDCAWSCYCCMLNGPSTYSFWNRLEGKKRLSLTLPEACRKLKVEVELFSYEPGMCFAEHICVGKNGKVLKQESVDYTEPCIDGYENFDELKKDYDENGWDLDLTEELFNEAKREGYDYVPCCEYFEGGSSLDYEWPFALAV